MNWAPTTVLSIDLGTSNTVAVLAAHGRPPRVIDIDGASAMPSAVFATEDGRLVTGREAVRLARLSPARFEPNPKRRIDEDNLLLGDAVVPVATALAAVLGKVLAEATRQLGGAWPDEVRLTHPAQWGSARCAVLLAAARQAGLTANVHLVPEPVAAAAHYVSMTGRPLAPEQALAVYDLGAGTFDAALVAGGQHGFTVLAESGLADLGGLDLDQALLDHLGARHADRDPAAWQRVVAPESVEERRAARAVREDVRIAKESLSEHPQTEVALPEPFGAGLVTRVELEGLIEPGLRRSVELLAATAQRAGLAAGQLAGVYLVGGSSRIPLVAKLIAERLGVVPTALDQPETAVAFGAHQVAVGHLAAPTHQVHAPWPAPPRGGHRRAVLIGALSLALVAAVVTVIALAPWRSTEAATPSSSSAGPNGKGGFHWSLTRGETGFYVGMWATDDTVIVGGDTSLAAYDPESGTRIWQWSPPKDTFVCNMTTSTVNGIGALTYGTWGDKAEDCHYLQTIDIETGKAGWKDPVKLVADGYTGWLGKLGGTSLSISETTVTAPYAGENAQDEHSTDMLWVDVKSGEVKGRTDLGPQEMDNGCRLTGYAQAVAASIIAIGECAGADSSTMLTWDEGEQRWRLADELDGCTGISNIHIVGFMDTAGGRLAIGCAPGLELEQLFLVREDGYSLTPMDLTGVAVDTVSSLGGIERAENVLLTKDTTYLLRGAEGISDGVVAVSNDYGQAWEHKLSGVSELRLLAATDEAATVLVTTPGPAKLYTVSGANHATEGPKLDPDVADQLPDAKYAVRIGDYLVCAFDNLNDDETIIGVVRAA